MFMYVALMCADLFGHGRMPPYARMGSLLDIKAMLEVVAGVMCPLVTATGLAHMHLSE